MASLPILLHNVRVDRSVFFSQAVYSFSDDTITNRCHHETGNAWVNVGCCGGSGSSNCGENNEDVVLDVLIRSINSTEFYADWTTSSSSRINTTNLRTACDQARVAVSVRGPNRFRYQVEE